MSSLNNVVSVSISRETQSVTQAAFGTPGIIAEFSTTKTTVEFDRYREYASLTEMSEDGWGTDDEVYQAASLIFSQNPKVDKVMVGRKDSGDADWDEALTTISLSSNDWYVFCIIASHAGTVVFDADFVASNAIDFTINDTVVTTVNFTTDQATTMSAIKAQIESDVTGSSVTIDSSDPDNRTLIIEVFGQSGVDSVSVAVTGGVSQPAAAITYINEDDYKEAAAWAETQKKLFIYCSSSSAIKNPSSTSDIAYFVKNLGYERTISCYHTDAQGDADPAFFETGWIGETLPYDPGSQTWCYKTITGLSPYSLKSSERTAILAKNCNIYTTTGGINNTEQGKVASGEFIDVMRGLDWLEARLQEAVWSDLASERKIPYTDEGVTMVTGTIRGVLEEAARAGLLVLESIEISAPAVADIPTASRTARTLPDINFSATLQGAIHKVEIEGIVTI
ncbi:MAG: DUF3383 family protein [Nitrosopumilaceae archaeon]|jgi:hypothetical protein